ncbi:40S ribosomal protein S21 [Aix galericulata]|nr:40S ribosomal protein S21 [Aix galericulata]
MLLLPEELRSPQRAAASAQWSTAREGSAGEMQNDAGEFVDLYVPRKCSASNRIIGAKDHASIQINISEVDKVTGRVNGQFKTYAICGAIRRMGESDDSILRLAKNDGIVSKNF